MFFYKYGILGAGYLDIESAIAGSLSLKILILLAIVKISLSVYGDWPINNDDAPNPFPCPTSTIGIPTLFAN